MKMAHSTVMIHFCFLVLTCLNLSTGANVLSLEDGQLLQQLRDSHFQFKEMTEAKVSRLELLEQEQKSKIIQLEAKVQQLELADAKLPQSKALTNNKIMPTSCADLKQVGHLWNGLYSVIGSSTVETVYCDFTKLPTDPAMQTFIGYVDVKSKPTYFSGQLNYNWYGTGTPIAYDNIVVNIGNAYDRATKKFTAPTTGRYFVSFSGRAFSYYDPSDFSLDLNLIKNGLYVAKAAADDIGTGYEGETLSFQSILNLIAGDQLWTEVSYTTAAGISLLGPDYTHFSVLLIEEDVSLSLKTI